MPTTGELKRTVDLKDIYSARCRWMLTLDEVKGWHRELGFASVKTTELH